MENILRNKIIDAISFTTVLFVLLLALFEPILDSDDNLYILYSLAGGYGNKPTHLLHYYYEWHPLLFWPISRLFYYFPNFNWYTMLLLLLQWISCINLAYLFLVLYKRFLAIFLLFLFFLFFQSRFLLSLNDSNTSFILAISGCSSLLTYYHAKHQKDHCNWKRLLLPVLLILLGGLLRIHTTALYIVLSLCMGLIMLPRNHYKQFATTLVGIGIILAIFVMGHISYYEQKIPNMKAEERLRQSLFYLANRPGITDSGSTKIGKVKSSFIRSWFLFDKNFISDEDISTFVQGSIDHRFKNTEENQQIIYWTFINSRVYLLLVAILLFYFMTFRNRKAVKRWLLMLLPAVLIYLYLAIFLKVTEGIFLTLQSSIFLSAVFCLEKESFRKIALKTASVVLLIFNIFWMAVRLKKINEVQTEQIRHTRAQLTEISSTPHILFIDTGHGFKSRAFYIWDTPSVYPLKNLIHKEMVINNSYQSTLERFRINDLMQELPYRSDILLFNQVDPLLVDYYQMWKGLRIKISEITGFTSLTANQVKIE